MLPLPAPGPSGTTMYLRDIERGQQEAARGEEQRRYANEVNLRLLDTIAKKADQDFQHKVALAEKTGQAAGVTGERGRIPVDPEFRQIYEAAEAGGRAQTEQEQMKAKTAMDRITHQQEQMRMRREAEERQKQTHRVKLAERKQQLEQEMVELEFVNKQVFAEQEHNYRLDEMFDEYQQKGELEILKSELKKEADDWALKVGLRSRTLSPEQRILEQQLDNLRAYAANAEKMAQYEDLLGDSKRARDLRRRSMKAYVAMTDIGNKILSMTPMEGKAAYPSMRGTAEPGERPAYEELTDEEQDAYDEMLKEEGL